jgi:predicted ATPase
MSSDSGALVGRDTELARLTSWIDDLATGSGQAVLVAGEPGIGKSALARSAVAAAQLRGFRCYWAECDELGQALPLQPLLDALLAKEPAEPRLDTIQRLLRGELTGSADPIVAASEQLLALMTELCSAAPVVMVVDDLQWADLATIGVWEWLARSVERAPLLLVGIVRPVPQRDELQAIRRVVGPKGTIRLDGVPGMGIADLVTPIADHHDKAGGSQLMS